MRVLMIGAGGVGGVVAHKLTQVPEVFTDILLASRTKSRVDALAAELSRPVETAQVDADRWRNNLYLRSLNRTGHWSGRRILTSHLWQPKITRINVFQESARTAEFRLAKLKTSLCKRQVTMLFGTGNGYIEQTAFFLQSSHRIHTHGAWEQVFFQTHYKYILEFQPLG